MCSKDQTCLKLDFKIIRIYFNFLNYILKSRTILEKKVSKPGLSCLTQQVNKLDSEMNVRELHCPSMNVDYSDQMFNETVGYNCLKIGGGWYVIPVVLLFRKTWQ